MKVTVYILVHHTLPATVYLAISQNLETLKAKFKEWFKKDWGKNVEFSVDMHVKTAESKIMQYHGKEVNGVFIQVFVEYTAMMQKLSTSHVIGGYCAAFFRPKYEIAAVVRPHRPELIAELK